MRGANRGSIIIEMTLLMPVFLVVFYFYIMTFLYYVETGKQMNELAVMLYQENGESGEVLPGKTETIQIYNQGGTWTGILQDRQKWTDITLVMKRDGSNPVRNLRRWQIVADTVH